MVAEPVSLVKNATSFTNESQHESACRNLLPGASNPLPYNSTKDLPQPSKTIDNSKEPCERDEVPKDELKSLRSDASHTQVARKDFDDQHDELREVLTALLPQHVVKPSNTQLWVYPVVQYRENQNPILPLTLQQKLDEMAPQEFLNYVHEELTLEERESLMVDEGQRRKTFQVNWPHSGQLSGVKMAQAGFYFLNTSDRVQCVFCRGSLHAWSENDSAMAEHAKAFNFCRFVKGLECGNREYRSKKLAKDDLINITTFTNAHIANRKQARNGEIDSGPLGICTSRAAMIKYAPDSARLRTYTRWPGSHPVTAEQLCDAGFYYSGFDDQVRCFYCAGGIREWADGDDPWEEHARWFPDCSYLLNKKGKDYVEEVQSKTPEHKKFTRKTKSQKKSEQRQETARTAQEEMKIVCKKLGHSDEDIDKVLVTNGKPFDKIRDMIDALYSLEESISSDDLTTEKSETGTTSFVPSTEERAQQSPVQQATLPAESKQTAEFVAACKLCQSQRASFTPASYVALPCGHLVYCESCNEDELKKSSTQQPKCPYPQCDTLLTGTIRVYFA